MWIQSRYPQPGDTTCPYYHTNSHKRLIYHPATLSICYIFPNTHTFSHPPNFVLLCLNIYLSLPSYVLTSRKSAKWTSRLEPRSLYGVINCSRSPIFRKDRLDRALQVAILTGSSLNYLKDGRRFGNPEARPLPGTFESNHKMAAVKVSA